MPSSSERKPGDRYGHLTLLYRLPGSRWLVKCDCGKVVDIFTNTLSKSHGMWRTCGCRMKNELDEQRRAKKKQTREEMLARKIERYNERKLINPPPPRRNKVAKQVQQRIDAEKSSDQYKASQELQNLFFRKRS